MKYASAVVFALLLLVPFSSARAGVVSAVTQYQTADEVKENFKNKIGPLGRKLFLESVKFKNLYHRHLQIMAYTYAGSGYSGKAAANADAKVNAIGQAGQFSQKLAGNIGSTLKSQFQLFKVKNKVQSAMSSQAVQNPQKAIKQYQKSANSAIDSISNMASTGDKTASDESAPDNKESQQSQGQMKGATKYLAGQAKGLSKQLQGFNKSLKNNETMQDWKSSASTAMTNLQNVHSQINSALQTARAMQNIQFGWLDDIRKGAVDKIKKQTTELSTILGFGRSIKPQVYKVTELMMQRSALRAAESSEARKRSLKLVKTDGSMTSQTRSNKGGADSGRTGNNRGASPGADDRTANRSRGGGVEEGDDLKVGNVRNSISKTSVAATRKYLEDNAGKKKADAYVKEAKAEINSLIEKGDGLQVSNVRDAIDKTNEEQTRKYLKKNVGEAKADAYIYKAKQRSGNSPTPAQERTGMEKNRTP